MKIKIELSPYNAAAIYGFMREFINEENADEYRFKAIHEAVDEFEKELNKITSDQLEDLIAENQINQLIGKSPKR